MKLYMIRGPNDQVLCWDQELKDGGNYKDTDLVLFLDVSVATRPVTTFTAAGILKILEDIVSKKALLFEANAETGEVDEFFEPVLINFEDAGLGLSSTAICDAPTVRFW